jgi:iron uptake system EfeUOB component EfeO/EfeM
VATAATLPVDEDVAVALVGRAEPDSHMDLVCVQADVDGLHGLVDALGPAVVRRDPRRGALIAARLASVDAALRGLGGPASFEPMGLVDPGARRGLAEALDALGDALAPLGATLARPVAR